ncbi:ABC transporter permease subunit [Actinoplanes sp. NPDC026619]|uniref:ABC transporter permease subunit n=1 Tax=Actinoplanes sp. NPDC026619 TaxID=3155798 RepID=UPI0033DF767F
MSLYKAETRRLVKRRFTKLFTIGALLILAAVAVGVFLTNEKVGPSQIAEATAHAQADYKQAVERTEQEKTTCESVQGTARAADYPPNCEFALPAESDFNPEWYMPPTFDLKENFGDMVTTMAAVLALVAFVIGASYVGAEWSSGGMMNLLLWRPRRLQVLSTKLSALLVGMTALTIVVAAAWTAIFYGIAKTRGVTTGMTSGVWQSTALMELRALVLVLVAGALGFGLASLGRHTAMALGVAIGVIVVFQFGVGAVLSIANVKFPELYLAPFWIVAWMTKKYTSEDYNSCNFDVTGGCQPETLTITWQMAGSALAIVVVLVVGAAMWTMRKRDIT